MKRLKSSMLGVTLLEIMLVLAIAAMIIVMSVRYYQSASISQQANAFLSQVQAISSAMNSMSQSTGTYSGLSETSIQAILPPNGLIPPWGGSGLTVAGSSTGFTITAANVPTGVCDLVTRQLTASANYTVASGCGTITYTLNP
ncbi:hypothetical protein [Aquicella lusitana]|uniref:Prepilin-type N-terminal cleavage/methylation domain-containing protein n=1 Tax=Aquicella lusitana TaxID=254246 RepID=A0A370GX44_9COXI|nr:hypothetical protein [Aquicella lusitana]RDI46483.1 hypothetical protein C8D86_1057 [Aquicella lusitana]VVC74147.1 Major structural subunit of bundle-forming pilus [Aquicella lusitana]